MGSKASGIGTGLQERSFCLGGPRAGWREVRRKGFAGFLQGKLVREKRSFRNPAEGKWLRLAGTQRRNSRWCGGARLKLKGRSLWWV